MDEKIQKNVDLSQFTSFKVGGKAENLVCVSTTNGLIEILKNTYHQKIWLLGYGSNSLITDGTLPGLTVIIKGGSIEFLDESVIADAGVWWDDIVSQSIEKNLWGLELMSEIPGSLGAALYINITAYGQSIGKVVSWIDVWDRNVNEIVRLNRNDLEWSYKKSIFQEDQNSQYVILRACLKLSSEMTDKLTYQKAIDVANELELETDSLQNRREIIIESRKKAGSLWDPDCTTSDRTAGSFFRNPVVTEEQALRIISYDESGKTKEQIEKMNVVHGGDKKRVSAAHVMLSAGFRRGQTWGNIKLNDHNLLKIEALPGSKAQELYDVMLLIQKTCFEKVGVHLEPEVKIIGEFKD